MKSTIETNSRLFRVPGREVSSEKAISKKIILLLIVQTVLFYFFSLFSSMEMQSAVVNNIAIGGLLIAVLLFINLLILIKWTRRTIEQRIASLTQLALPIVFTFVWIYMLM